MTEGAKQLATGICLWYSYLIMGSSQRAAGKTHLGKSISPT